MWSAFVRQFAAYVLTRRGKKLFAFVGAMLLVFATALLIDMQLFASAGVTGTLAAFATGVYAVQHAKLKRREHERRMRIAEDAIRRTERAKARSEKIDRTKAAFTGAVSGAVNGTARVATGAVTGTAKFFADAATEIAHEVSDAYVESRRILSGALDSAADTVSRGADSLMRTGRDALARGLAFFRSAREGSASPTTLVESRIAAPHAVPRIARRPELN